MSCRVLLCPAISCHVLLCQPSEVWLPFLFFLSCCCLCLLSLLVAVALVLSCYHLLPCCHCLLSFLSASCLVLCCFFLVAFRFVLQCLFLFACCCRRLFCCPERSDAIFQRENRVGIKTSDKRPMSFLLRTVFLLRAPEAQNQCTRAFIHKNI